LIVFFVIACLYLIIAMCFSPPGHGKENSLIGAIPYYVVPTTVFSTLALGALYWVCFAKIVPLVFGYQVDVERYFDQDGVEVVKYRHIKPKPEGPPRKLTLRRRQDSSNNESKLGPFEVHSNCVDPNNRVYEVA
jgi:hypothetical protein